jgi:hypothetical protein
MRKKVSGAGGVQLKRGCCVGDELLSAFFLRMDIQTVQFDSEGSSFI